MRQSGEKAWRFGGSFLHFLVMDRGPCLSEKLGNAIKSRFLVSGL